jgi:predicted Zn-dependent peptidase
MYSKYAYQYDYQAHIQQLKKYKPMDMGEYIKNHIFTNNVVVCVTCPPKYITHAALMAKKYFGHLKMRRKASHKITFAAYKHKNNGLKIIYVRNKTRPGTRNAAIKLVVDRNIKYASRRHIALLLIRHILCNANTGVLFVELRRKLGLIYSIGFNVVH